MKDLLQGYVLKCPSCQDGEGQIYATNVHVEHHQLGARQVEIEAMCTGCDGRITYDVESNGEPHCRSIDHRVEVENYLGQSGRRGGSF